MPSLFRLLVLVAVCALVVLAMQAQPVVVNKYYNAGIGNVTQDAVELLVVQNNADLRGMLIKDFANNMNDDAGGIFRFASNALWASVPQGTLIVLRNDASSADVAALPDFVIDVGLNNLAYFSNLSGAFDISTTDMVMVKQAGAAAAGVTGSIHALAAGMAGSFYTSAPTPKLIASAGAAGGTFALATNPNSTLPDFNGTNATGGITGLVLGNGSNTTNQAYINQLRNTAGSLALSTSTLAFDSLALGDSATLSYTITGTNLTQSITVGSSNPVFSLSYNGSAYSNTINLPAGGGTVAIKFKPVQQGAQTATIAHTSGTYAQSLTATGRTITPAIVPAQTSFAFGNVAVGAARILKCAVTGRALPTAIAASIPASAPFRISRTGGNFFTAINLQLPTDTLFVRFAPTPAGAVSNTITLASGGVTVLINVTGTGVQPSLTLQPSTLNFGQVPVGLARTLRYQVRGNNLAGAIVATLGSGSPFALSKDSVTFASSLQLPDSGGTVWLRYTPLAAGSDNLVLAHNSVPLSTNLTINALAIPPPAPAISILPTALNFGTLLTGRTATLGSFVVGISLGQNITINLPSGSPFSVSSDNISFSNSLALPPAGGALFVRYNPPRSANDSFGLALISGSVRATLPVSALAADFNANTSIVVNKFQNATVDAVELLVVRNNINAQGIIVKDFSNNMAADGGGKYAFTAHPLWASLRAGTLIILRNDNSQTDTNATDYVLDVGLSNPAFFTNLDPGGRFDIAGNEMLMLKAAGSPAAGISGSLHALCSGSGPLLDAVAVPRLTASTYAGAGEFVMATTPNRLLTDYHGTDALGAQNGLRLGQGNNTANADYIRQLRGSTTSIGVLPLAPDAALRVQPNPADDVLLLTFPTNRPGLVVANIYNGMGALQHRIQWPNVGTGLQQLPCAVGALPAGLYLLELVLENEARVLTARFLVAH